VKRILAGLLAFVLLAAAGTGIWLARRPVPPPPPSAQDLAALEARRVELRRQIDEVVHGDDQGLSQAPKAGILIGMPTLLTRSVVSQIVTGLFGETTLTLRNLKARLSKDVKAKLLLRKATIGHIDLEVDIHEVQGMLKPGAPDLAFGGNRIAVRLPVSVASGQGRATLHAKWDSKGVANAVCGDVEVHPEVSGTVVPTDYEISGAFAFAVEGQKIVLQPDFGDLQVRIYVKATEESWKVVEQVVQERGKVCRMALDKVDLRAQLEKLLAKGFNVKIPKKIFKPIRLPAGVERSLEMQGVKLTLQVESTGLTVTPDRIWYGADVRASDGRATRAGAPAPPPPPPPPSAPPDRKGAS
jgi:hypothetical protein